MAADGADLIGARAGFQAGAQLANILPFPHDEYLADFADADAQVVFKEVVTQVASPARIASMSPLIESSRARASTLCSLIRR
jgi:hypothetical protein